MIDYTIKRSDYMDISKLEEKDYHLYQKLIDQTMDCIEEIVNPVIINDNGIINLICALDGFYSIASSSKNVLVRKEKGYISNVIDEKYHYQMYLDADIPIVSKVDLKTNDLEQLFLTKPNKQELHPFLHYYQGKNNGEYAELELEYDVINYLNRLQDFFNYLDNHQPDVASLILLKEFLIFKYKSHESYALREEDKKFVRCLDTKWGFIRLFDLGKKYYYEEFQDYIKQFGLNISINRELIEIFNRNNRIINDYDKLLSQYDEYIKVR